MTIARFQMLWGRMVSADLTGFKVITDALVCVGVLSNEVTGQLLWLFILCNGSLGMACRSAKRDHQRVR